MNRHKKTHTCLLIRTGKETLIGYMVENMYATLTATEEYNIDESYFFNILKCYNIKTITPCYNYSLNVLESQYEHNIFPEKILSGWRLSYFVNNINLIGKQIWKSGIKKRIENLKPLEF
ncbi:hypothetical protein KUTeg_025054 [Tegillarca granosa]|uniref:Homing endonuclease LAGLIDADG domain-containing protein n=1 Tax=Tegillarca granosa TaxID=220873 RepID=A0ABQ9DZ27_TEGGR|nr:hypothetical protein KUTeg_025054 [Tegillarca granosa]